MEDSWHLFVGLLLLVGGLVWVVNQIRTRLRDDADHMTDKMQLLKQMRELHREGDLSEAEFRSIKSRLLVLKDFLPQQPDHEVKQTITEDCPDSTLSESEEE